jgi:hypothetical protein
LRNREPRPPATASLNAMKKTSELLSGLAVCFAGIVLLAVGVYLLMDRMQFTDKSIQAEGTVIEVETSRRNNSTYYKPVISFKALNGNTYSFASDTGTNAALDYNKGDKIMVRYPENKPEMARIDSFFSLWGLPLALLGAGIAIGSSGVVMVYKKFNKIKPGD